MAQRGLKWVGGRLLVLSGLACALVACASSAPATPDEAVAATWESFTESQKEEACSFVIEGRSTYGSSYIAERAVKLYPQFVEGDLYNAAGRADFLPEILAGQTAVEEPICDPYRAPEDRASALPAKVPAPTSSSDPTVAAPDFPVDQQSKALEDYCFSRTRQSLEDLGFDTAAFKLAADEYWENFGQYWDNPDGELGEAPDLPPDTRRQTVDQLSAELGLTSLARTSCAQGVARWGRNPSN